MLLTKTLVRIRGRHFMRKSRILIVWNTNDRSSGFDSLCDQNLILEHIDFQNLTLDKLNEEYSGIILSGTDASPINNIEVYQLQQSLFNQIDIPILAICGAFQVMAMTFGAQISDCDSPVYGRTSVVHNQTVPLLAKLPTEFTVFCKHRWAIRQISAPLEAFAWSSDYSYVYGIRLKNSPHYGLQFHPERRNDGTLVLRNFVNQILKFDES